MALRVNAEQFAEKHARRLKASEPDIRIGIERVTTAPGQLAAAKKDKMKAKLVARIDDGTWGRRVAAVGLDEWKKKAITKGVPRIATGIDEAHDKVVDFASQLLPVVDRVRTEVLRMPDLTVEDGIARASKFIRDMSKFKKK